MKSSGYSQLCSTTPITNLVVLKGKAKISDFGTLYGKLQKEGNEYQANIL